MNITPSKTPGTYHYTDPDVINNDLIPKQPNHWVKTRAIVTVVAIGAITAYILSASGHLTTFPADFVSAITSTKGIIAASTVGGVVLVASGIIHNIRTREGSGRFTGHDHFQPAYSGAKESGYAADDPNLGGLSVREQVEMVKKRGRAENAEDPAINPNYGYVDNSARVEIDGKVYRPIYVKKHPGEHESIAIQVMIATPIHAATAMAWNAIRIVFKPLQLIAMAGYEVATGKDRKHFISDIPKEIARSIWNIVKAPFYMTAMMMASLYSLANPINGRKLGYLIEQEWGGGKMHHESIWAAPCIAGCTASFFWKDVWRKMQKGTTFEIPGCWRPIGYVSVNETTNEQEEVISYTYLAKKKGASQKVEGLFLFLPGFRELDQQGSG